MGKRPPKKDAYIKVIETIKKYQLINDGDTIIVGVSGGPDSMCLLDILKKIKEEKTKSVFDENFNIVVVHVNHMIREEAEEDAKFVEKYCEKNHIQFYSKSIDVQKLANNNKISVEEAGRNARYEFFNEVLKKVNGNKIAIAHNKNDKVETIIMNELRGCGISGLKGIEPKRDQYIRPLIECERKEIEEYCSKNDLQPRIDKTNFENTYTRNKIRNIVIPFIKEEFNPNIIETVNRLSELVTEQEDYIQKQVKLIYKKILIKENIEEVWLKENNSNVRNTNIKEKNIDNQEIKYKKNDRSYILLDWNLFNQQEKVIKSNIILYTITRLFHTTKGVEKIHIEDIIQLCDNKIGNKFLMPNKNLKVFVKKGIIKFSKEI